jgi:hypothetical protein
LRFLALALSGLALGAGCGQNLFRRPDTPAASAPADVTEPAVPGVLRDPGEGGPVDAEGNPAPTRALMVVQVSFDVLQARVPRGFFSDSGKIWNHLNEEVVPARLSLLLQQNGLRVARGDVNSWPPIKALLDQQGQVETSQNQLLMNSGYPLTIELNSLPRDQTLFMLRPDGTLGGASFPQSTNCIRIEYELAPTNASALTVVVTPEVRLPKQPPRLNPDVPGFIDHPIGPPARVLRELGCELEIGPDQFLVVGPSSFVKNPHLVGALFLCDEVEGRRVESVYFITPKVLNTRRKLGF